jgi:1-acyl-sn-glycerol-3-phosphate acyltransferase
MFHLKAQGRQFIPRKGGFILVSNHASYLDPIILGCISPRTLNYAARDTLFKDRIFSWLLVNLGVFPIKRWSVDLSAVRESLKRLKNDSGLVVFPEGTRSADGGIQNITHGFVLLADRAGVPIIPARIFGSHKAWPRTKKIFQPAKIRVVVGEPVYVKKNLSYPDTAREVFMRIKHLKYAPA